MPTSCWVPTLTTGTAPTFWSSMISMTSLISVSGVTDTTSEFITVPMGRASRARISAGFSISSIAGAKKPRKSRSLTIPTS